jgi:integrase
VRILGTGQRVRDLISLDDNDCIAADGLGRGFWANASRVREVFKVAFRNAGLPPFTPHSFRNLLVAVAYDRHHTPGLNT